MKRLSVIAALVGSLWIVPVSSVLALDAKELSAMSPALIGDADEQSKILAELEKDWVAGNQLGYFLKGDAFLSHLIEVVAIQSDQIANLTKYLGSYLRKTGYIDSDAYQRGVMSKVHVLKSYGSLIRNKPQFATAEALENFAGWVGDVLVEIDKRCDAQYVPRPVAFNLPLPKGVEGFAGMDPKAIKDPVARAEYQQAIDVVEVNSKENSIQRVLKAHRVMLAEQVESTYITLKAKMEPAQAEKLQDLLKKLQ